MKLKKRYKFLFGMSIIFILLVIIFYHLWNGNLIFWVPRGEQVDVLLDPGHGDHDPGCIFKDLKEKDFNLKMAKQVQKHLETKGLKVKLTRETDEITWEHHENADLRARVAKSIAHDPILFVSMHINSSPDPKGNGFEIYASEFRSLSKQAAHQIYDNVQSLNYFKGRNVKTSLQRSLFVIDMNANDAILIETGFLSNEHDRTILLNETAINNICYKIADGIYDSVIQSEEYQKRYGKKFAKIKEKEEDV